jgi:hypothetical protein
LLGNALDRLQSTTVKTNIRSGDAVETTFSWIDSYSQLKDRNGQVRGMRITLAKWFYDGALMEGGVLAIDPTYFSLTGGRERWLYRVARKHAGGAGAKGFSISMPTLFEESAAEGDYRRFKFEMSKIARENDLSGYALELIQREEGEPILRMARRDLDVRESPLPYPFQEKAATKAGKLSVESYAPSIRLPEQGQISYSAFGAIARANLPQPQRDHASVNNDFRLFLKSREIGFDVKNITSIFAFICAKQRPAT